MKFQEFNDFDAYVSDIRDADVRCLLNASETRRWLIGHQQFEKLSLQIGIESAGMICEAEARSDGLILFLPLENAQAQSANGQQLDENRVSVFGPGGEFCLGITDAHKWCTLFIPREEILANISESRSADLFQPKCQTLILDPCVRLRLHGIICSLTDLLSVHFEETLSTPALVAAESELLKAISNALEQSEGTPEMKDGRPLLSRREIIRRAHDRIDASEVPIVSLRELAQTVDSSERTLRQAFKEYFGVGPARYQKIRLLHQIREDLRQARGHSETVKEILFRRGIWELGRFAGDYLKQFGEFPSDTLRG